MTTSIIFLALLSLSAAACATGGGSGLADHSQRTATRFGTGEINIICTDFGRSLKFYRDVLGFEVLAGEKQDGVFVHMRCGEHQFLLFACAKSALPRAPYEKQAGFSVDLITYDLEAEARRLKEAGVDIERDWKPGAGSIWIRDPDGLAFEVIQRRQ